MYNSTYNLPQAPERSSVRGRQHTPASPRRSRGRTTYNKSGFTMVEMVVYVGILALILVGVVNMILAVSSTFGELRATRQLNRSASVLLDRFVREVRDADSVRVGPSVFDTHPGELELDYGAGLPRVRFYVDNGTVKIDRGGIYEGDLTVPGVSATSFVLRHITGTGWASESVRLEITLDSISGKGSALETFYVSAVVRGSYGL